MFAPRNSTQTAPPLVDAAQQTGLAFEASPNGRWIRLVGSHGAAYVVQDPWGDGCLVVQIGTPQGRSVRHFLSPSRAVREAAGWLGAPTSRAKAG